MIQRGPQPATSPDGYVLDDWLHLRGAVSHTDTSAPSLCPQHIYTLLSPPFATEDAPARPDLNSIAHLVLHYLPFSTPAADNASIALRSTLLTAIGHAERGYATCKLTTIGHPLKPSRRPTVKRFPLPERLGY